MGDPGEFPEGREVLLSSQRACILGCFNCVWLFVTLWTVARQAPLSMGFSRQEYWSGLPCLPPCDLPDTGIEPVSPASPALAAGSLPLTPPGKSVRVEWDNLSLEHSYPSCSLGWAGSEAENQADRKKGAAQSCSGWSISFEIRQTSFLFQFWGCLTVST